MMVSILIETRAESVTLLLPVESTPLCMSDNMGLWGLSLDSMPVDVGISDVAMQKGNQSRRAVDSAQRHQHQGEKCGGNESN